jgi:hypothetical protein
MSASPCYLLLSINVVVLLNGERSRAADPPCDKATKGSPKENISVSLIFNYKLFVLHNTEMNIPEHNGAVGEITLKQNVHFTFP